MPSKLEGNLDFSEFVNLEKLTFKGIFERISELDVSKNTKLTKLVCSLGFLVPHSFDEGLVAMNLGNCPSLVELDCSNNQLNDTTFLEKLSCPEKLVLLSIGNNRFAPQTIDFLEKFINLEKLCIVNNNFYGSLKPLKNMNNLKSLVISNTNIDSGLEYLPNNLKKIFL